ncbi:MAG: protein-glutamate O-methyltransferase CheR, partial [Gammaproteobacteria bacterium]|nr:protein-glutamate O-methyltransferase CheR [Gammaproteobacteria bacterium]
MLFSRMKFTERDFRFIQGLLLEQAGISLSNEKSELVYSRLARRLRLLGLNDFSDYCDLLKEANSREIEHCLNAITTNHTSFFREDHHFTFLSNVLLPGYIKRAAKTGRKKIRIWSAGCSSGEEPYSIAITIKEFGKALDDWDISIMATDIDSNILEQAQAGVYRQFNEKDPSFANRRKWFQKGKGANAGLVKIVPEIRKMIRFEKMNLK